jgi:hypothetical protein
MVGLAVGEDLPRGRGWAKTTGRRRPIKVVPKSLPNSHDLSISYIVRHAGTSLML